MGGRTRLAALAVTLVVVVAVSGFVAPAAADHRASDDHGASDDPGRADRGDEQRRSDDDGNSSIVVHIRVHGPGGGGSGGFECEGTPLRHECDKEGTLRSGPAGVDYEGNNSADFRNRSGGGGDTVTVGVRDRSATVGFDSR